MTMTTTSEDQRADGKRREALGGAWTGGWTTFIDGGGCVREVESFDDGYNKLIDRIDNPTFEDTFEGIFDEALDLLVQRQHKYGPNNIAGQGMWGVLTRIADDKISRLKRAFNGSIVNGKIELDEIVDPAEQDTFEDACLDVMNYAAILLALYRGEWGRPLQSELPEPFAHRNRTGKPEVTT